MLKFMIAKGLGGKEPEEEMGEDEFEVQVVKDPSPLPPRTLKLFHLLAWLLFVFSMGIWFPSHFPLASYLSAELAEGRGLEA